MSHSKENPYSPPEDPRAASSPESPKVHAGRKRWSFLLVWNLVLLAVVAASELMGRFAINTGSRSSGEDLVVYQEYVSIEWDPLGLIVLWSLGNGCLLLILRFFK